MARASSPREPPARTRAQNSVPHAQDVGAAEIEAAADQQSSGIPTCMCASATCYIAEGTARMDNGRLLIWNPLYRVQSADAKKE